MAEKSVNILEIITGALMIVAPLFGWWIRIESGELDVSIAFWEWGLYDEIQLWQSLFLFACSIIFLVGGALYILNAINLLKPLGLIRFILLCAGFAGLLASTAGIMIDHGLPIFESTAYRLSLLGPGLYLGIAALVFGVIGFIKDFKKNT